MREAQTVGGAEESRPACVEATCGPDGVFQLDGVTLATWQAVELPRVWDGADREPDDDPAEQLAGMFERITAALHAWTEMLDHLR